MNEQSEAIRRAVVTHSSWTENPTACGLLLSCIQSVGAITASHSLIWTQQTLHKLAQGVVGLQEKSRVGVTVQQCVEAVKSMLYHEKQVAALCGVHCINCLLQGPYFSEMDLAQIGHQLDQLEQQMLEDAAGPSGNLDESGMFSIQVLTKALQVWGLTALNVESEEVTKAKQPFEPLQEEAFICNLLEHWFTIRKVGGEWWNFNSLYPAPEALSQFYLTAYLDSLKQQGYTIFVIRGQLPALHAAAGAEDEGGPGKWWSPEEARTAHESAQAARQLGRARKGVEDALTRAAAAGGTLTLRPSNKRTAASQLEDDEDEDLAAAIAASLEHQSGDTQAAGAPPAAAATGAAAGGSSYAAVAARAGRRQRSGSLGRDAAGDLGAAGVLEGDGDVEEDDPELAAALAASLQEHNQAQQQTDQQQQQQQAGQQPAEVEQPPQAELCVPEEPAEGSAGVLTVAFRLPSGARLSRRFSSTDSVSVLAAYIAQQMAASGELSGRQRVVLNKQFPKQVLEPEQQLEAAGVDDRSMLTVTVAM